MLEKLKNRIGNEDVEVSLYFLSKQQNKDSGKFEILKANYLEEIEIDFIAFFEKYLADNEYKEIVEYKYDNLSKGRIFEIPSSEIPLAEEIISELAKPLRNNPIDTLAGIARNYSAYLVRYKLLDKSIIVIRRITKNHILKQSKKFLLFMNRKGVLERLNKDEMFVFDEYIDCMIIDDKIFVFNIANFELIFKFKDYLLSLARNLRGTIEKTGKVKGWSNLVSEVLEKTSHLRKIGSIAKNKYYITIDMKELSEINRVRDIGIPMSNGTIVIPEEPSIDQIKVILRALNDEYTESPTTKNFYEVDSKSQIN